MTSTVDESNASSIFGTVYPQWVEKCKDSLLKKTKFLMKYHLRTEINFDMAQKPPEPEPPERFFPEDSIRFQCRYSRSVSVTQDMSIIDTPTDAVGGTDDLPF